MTRSLLFVAAIAVAACSGNNGTGTGGGSAAGGGTTAAGGGTTAAGGGTTAAGGGTTAAGGGTTAAGGGTTAAGGGTSNPLDAGTSDAGTPDSGTPDAGNGQWVVGYYVGYDIDAYPIASIDWSAVTHIVFSPMVVKSDLSLDLSFSDPHDTGPADATALSTAAHAHGVKALLMLGGANAGGNIATAASPAHLSAFVTALLNAMDTLGYDGIDLDWEDSVNLDDLVSLAAGLRTARPGIILTYPAYPINGNYQTVDPKMATLAQSLDRFNVQTYFPATAFAGQGWSSWFSSPISGASQATPIAIDDTLQRYVTAGVPKAKLGMGIAFYAICYTGGITGPRQATNGTTQTIVGGDNNYPLSLFFAAGGTFDTSSAGERFIDATTEVPYLALTAAVNDPGCGASSRYLTYDDETSIIAKGTFSKTNGYGGIIVWTLQEGWLPANASGGRAQNTLMQALKTGFLTP